MNRIFVDYENQRQFGLQTSLKNVNYDLLVGAMAFQNEEMLVIRSISFKYEISTLGPPMSLYGLQTNGIFIL